MPSKREEILARIAARRLRVQARRERVQARREARAARRAAGLREIRHVAPEVGAPPEKVEATKFGVATNIAFIHIVAVESSWVSHVMLILDRTTGERKLAVRFLDGYACYYPASSEADYNAMLAAPSKGKHIWAHWYGMGKRRIQVAVSGGARGPGQIAEAPGTVRTQGRRRRSIS
jgi:hypothetical protein